MRTFLDTNVLVAAFATRGLCEDVLRTVLAEHRLLTSEFVLEELRRVLAEKLRMPQGEAARVCVFVRENSEVVQPETAAIRTSSKSMTQQLRSCCRADSGNVFANHPSIRDYPTPDFVAQRT